MIYVHVLALDELADKGASERRTERAVEPSAVVIGDVFFDLFGDRDHIRKDQITSVKPVVIDTDQTVLGSKVINDVSEVRLPVAARSGQKHQGLAVHVPHFFKCHPNNPLLT